MREIKNVSERFWPKVQKTPTCWLWTGSKDTQGRGQFWVREKQHSVRAHRVAYELCIGKIPADLFCCHTCDNPSCVKPAHLFLGTQKDNMADCSKKDRTPHGTEHHKAKLSPESVRQIRVLYRTGNFSQRGLALEFGVCQRTICQVLVKRTWRRVA